MKTTFDGFGRPIKAESGDGGGTKSIVETEYEPCACSPLGKMKRVSMPYAPGGTVYWTTYTYDGLGRTVSVAHANGTGTTTYTYAGNTVTVTDPAGKWKKYEQDALGQVVKTTEPNPVGGADWETTASYNAFGKTTQVQMTRGAVTQTRSWSYYAGSQWLATETHPETGTTTYEYNGDGSLKKKTLADGKVVTYSYDSYGRVNQVTDSGSYSCSKKTYLYDSGVNGVGRLWRETVGDQSCTQVPLLFLNEYSYSTAGQVTKKRVRVIRNQEIGQPSPDAIDVNYTYNNEGQVTGVGLRREWSIYDDVAWTYTRDGMGRLSGMSGSDAASGAAYNAADQMTALTHGGLNETRQYNVRGQLTRITVAGQMDVEYEYSAAQNNGQITQMKNWVSGEEVNYSYDAVGRLSGASTTGPEWGLTFGYDGFGNLLSKTLTKGSAPVLSVAVDGATNRVVGHGYNAAGQTVSMPGISSMSWNGQGWLLSTSLTAGGGDVYSYDSSNRRTWKNSTLFVWGAEGKLLAEYTYDSGAFTLTYAKRYAWFGGKLVGKKEDRLGSVDQGGGRYYPYGEEQNATSQDRQKFGTYYRDSGSGLDYAMNRYYSAGNGRFLSGDPFGGSMTMGRSGSWNRYGYVEGDPVNAGDSTGLEACQDQARIVNEFTCPHVITGSAGGGDELRETMDSVIWDMRMSWNQAIHAADNFLNTPGARPNTTSTLYYNCSQGDELCLNAQTGAYVPNPASVPGMVDTSGDLAAVLQLGKSLLSMMMPVRSTAAYTPLYRAVQEGELRSIEQTGEFINPLGIENKYFSTSPLGASSYARKAYNSWPSEGPYTIVETSLRTDFINASNRVMVDQGIDIVTVPTRTLPHLTPPVVWPYAPLP